MVYYAYVSVVVDTETGEKDIDVVYCCEEHQALWPASTVWAPIEGEYCSTCRGKALMDVLFQR